MKDFRRLNQIKRKIMIENPVALCVETRDNGDMEYRTQLSDGTTVDFLVPKEKTFVRCEKMRTQEYSNRLTRFIKENI